jgi:alpha-D-glucose phosphate-specific phosphoglucomutase
MSKIKFGTDGWRAIMAEEFTFDNVKIVTQAIANYINNNQLKNRGIVIGYDNRFLSEKFAATVASVMNGNGIPVYMTVGATPTPVTAYAVKVHNAGGAVMLTASHNPPEYNGMKFIPEYAGPALPYITTEIEAEVHKVIEKGEIKELPAYVAKDKGLYQFIEPFNEYIEHFKTLIDLEAIKKAKLKIIVDPMFGAGIGYLDTILKCAQCQVEVIHGYRDPLFGGSMPEPSEKVLVELKERVLATGADLGLAMDGDADRFGIIDKDGTYISPNQVLFLVLNHLLRHKGFKGTVARSVATTHMLDKIAEKYGLDIDETPVGFKYIGESMMNKGSILGGEESGGLSIKGHIPEKDGILATALIAEIVAVNGKSLGEIMKELGQEVGLLVSERLDTHCDTQGAFQVCLGEVKIYKPETIAGKKVVSRNEVDGVKLILEDGSWVLIRASGTEPLFRIYVESVDNSTLKAIQEQVVKDLGI